MWLAHSVCTVTVCRTVRVRRSFTLTAQSQGVARTTNTTAVAAANYAMKATRFAVGCGGSTGATCAASSGLEVLTRRTQRRA